MIANNINIPNITIHIKKFLNEIDKVDKLINLLINNKNDSLRYLL